MSILVTGATGYIGSNIVNKLIERGNSTIGVVRSPCQINSLTKGIEPLLADFATSEGIDAIANKVKESDAVIHTGFVTHGKQWTEAVAIEQKFLSVLVEALKNTGKTLIVSNGTIFYGDTGNKKFEEDAPVITNHPAAIRARAISAVLQASQKGFRGIELRLASFVYGQGGSVFLPILLRSARETNQSIYIDKGDNRTSTVNVEDAARAYLDALDRGRAGEIYHIACDDEPTISDIARAVAVNCDAHVVSVSAEEASQKLDPFTAMFLNLNNRLSSVKARTELKWMPNAKRSLLWDVAYGSYKTS